MLWLFILTSLFVRKIYFEGVKTTDINFLKSELWHKEGGIFDSLKIKEDKERLVSLGIFTKVEPYWRYVGEDSVDIVFELREFPLRGVPSFNLWKDEDKGWVVGLGFNIINFRGKAQSLGFLLNIKGYTGGKFYFISPSTVSRHPGFGFYTTYLTYYRCLEEFKVLERSMLFQIFDCFQRNIKKNWKVYIGFDRIVSDSNNRTVEIDNSDEYIKLGFILDFNLVDYIPKPHKGFKLNILTSGAYGGENSVRSLKLGLSSSLYLPIYKDNLILVSGSSLEKIFGDYPIYFRLYSGGVYLRGYKYGFERGDFRVNLFEELRILINKKFSIFGFSLEPVISIFGDFSYLETPKYSYGFEFGFYNPMFKFAGFCFAYNETDKRLNFEMRFDWKENRLKPKGF
ncbi:hypothetical protein DRN73_08305 [Candidatus Pacearchaeota archaeon]|nr:MAG: hypothetical protein DRN73_08305 [Candidatus Pacearchaeota archaeon]